MKQDMNKTLQDLRVPFSVEEKAAIRENLVAFIQAHPVRKQPHNRHKPDRPSSLVAALSHWFSMAGGLHWPVVAVAVAGLFIVTSLYRAEASLPGHLLYPFKIYVSERMQLAFASPEERARQEMEIAQRRLEEAEMLLVNGYLDTVKARQLADNFENHAKAVYKAIEELRAQGSVGVAARLNNDFESALGFHSKILEEILLQLADENEIFRLMRLVDGGVRSTSELRLSMYGELTNKDASAIKALASEREQLARQKMQNALYVAASSNDKEIKDRIASTIKKSNSHINEGRSLMAKNDYADALSHYEEAYRIMQELWLFLQTKDILRLDFNLTERMK